VGNYVIVSPLQLGNYKIADTRDAASRTTATQANPQVSHLCPVSEPRMLLRQRTADDEIMTAVIDSTVKMSGVLITRRASGAFPQGDCDLLPRVCRLRGRRLLLVLAAPPLRGGLSTFLLSMPWQGDVWPLVFRRGH
jgi:hypothetical protein